MTHGVMLWRHVRSRTSSPDPVVLGLFPKKRKRRAAERKRSDVSLVRRLVPPNLRLEELVRSLGVQVAWRFALRGVGNH